MRPKAEALGYLEAKASIQRKLRFVVEEALLRGLFYLWGGGVRLR